MQEQPINFYLNSQSIEIMDKLEKLNKKFSKILSDFKKAEIAIEEERKEELFEKIKINARIRK